MKKFGMGLFYIVAFCGISYFLWEYLNAPREFIVSLIISVLIIGVLAWKKSPYMFGVGVILVVVHIVRLVGHFIPVYNEEPDIRQRYRTHDSMLRSVGGAAGDTQVTLVSANTQTVTDAAQLRSSPLPIYQGNQIITVGPAISSEGRVMLTFRDGSNAQLFPQSSLRIDTLAPDYATLSGSRLGLILERGIVAVATPRRSFTPQQWFVKAGGLYLSCRECIVALSGSAGSFSSEEPFTRRVAGGEFITLSGGSYLFTNNAIRASNNTALSAFFNDTTNTTRNRKSTYESERQQYIRDRRGWSMDASILLTSVSKIKMALVGLIDRTYLEKYDYLALYEYLLDGGEVPPPFRDQQHILEYTQ